MMTDMSGRTLLVAGSSRGIGAATAQLSPHLVALAAELDARAFECDGTDADAVHDAVGTLEADGVAIDALVCTLGAVTSTPALGGSTEDWVGDFRANVLAPANFIRAVAPGMRGRGRGRIVTVSSIRGRDSLASADVTGYSAAKAALENVTVSFAKELAPTITVNSVAPGFSLTDMSQTWTPEVRQEVERSLLGRAAEPDEIASVLLFLVSDAASFMTAQTVSGRRRLGGAGHLAARLHPVRGELRGGSSCGGAAPPPAGD